MIHGLQKPRRIELQIRIQCYRFGNIDFYFIVFISFSMYLFLVIFYFSYKFLELVFPIKMWGVQSQQDNMTISVKSIFQGL